MTKGATQYTHAEALLILGLPADLNEPNTDPESIAAVRKVYKKLCFKFHPDKNRSNPQAVEDFKKIGNAYDALTKADIAPKTYKKTAAAEKPPEAPKAQAPENKPSLRSPFFQKMTNDTLFPNLPYASYKSYDYINESTHFTNDFSEDKVKINPALMSSFEYYAKQSNKSSTAKYSCDLLCVFRDGFSYPSYNFYPEYQAVAGHFEANSIAELELLLKNNLVNTKGKKPSKIALRNWQGDNKGMEAINNILKHEDDLVFADLGKHTTNDLWSKISGNRANHSFAYSKARQADDEEFSRKEAAAQAKRDRAYKEEAEKLMKEQQELRNKKAKQALEKEKKEQEKAKKKKDQIFSTAANRQSNQKILSVIFTAASVLTIMTLANVSWPLIAACVVGTSLITALFQSYKSHVEMTGLEKYERKLQNSKTPLNKNEVEAFKLGIEAGKSNRAMLYSFSRSSTYSNFDAYAAGKYFAMQNEQSYINKFYNR